MKLLDLNNLSHKRLKALQNSGITDITELLHLFPRRYIDKSKVLPIWNLAGQNEAVTVVGKVMKTEIAGFGNKKRLEVIVQDHTGAMKAVFFKGWKYFIKQFNIGQYVSLYGIPNQYGRYISMAHPEVERLDSPDDFKAEHSLIPVYPSNKHLTNAFVTNKIIAGWINQILQNVQPKEFIPENIRQKHNFPDVNQAIRTIHNPSKKQEAAKALERFKYDEFFLFELSMAKIKFKRFEKQRGVLLEPGEMTKKFFNQILPFQLTTGQISALSDIRIDLKSGLQMNRLVQGDVGAGKTIVAIGSMLMAVDNNYQGAFMAPTEILAEQHYHTLKKYLEPLGIHFRLITGGQKAALRRDILTDIEGGKCQVAVGTHAIFQESVKFHNLGLVVIDEQHRFGVKQRNEMLQKGNNPHLLVMSATPIPRSLALTIYSDLDISVIRELPAGRKPVKTAVRSEKEREKVYSFLEQSIKNGDQVYVIFPLIEESEVMDLKDATMGFEKLKRRFPEISIGLLHGRMKPEEKEIVMKRFIADEIKILVSTTVVEVGVDVPNASIMIIEHAERFGLSQLHQLRGRIGRGSKQSYCILMPGVKLSRDGRYRLRKLVETTDGFEIAEADLKLRGPGDFLGTKQSGLPEFRYADIVEDRLLLEQAKNDAWQLIRSDPDLTQPENESLKAVFEPYFQEKAEFFGVG